MREIDIAEKLPGNVATLAKMIAGNIRVRHQCMTCFKIQDVDIIELRQRLGAEFSLIDVPGNCNAPGCSHGGVFEFWSVGNELWIPLITRSLARQLRDGRGRLAG